MSSYKQPLHCNVCDVPADLKCSTCKTTRYCTRSCQKLDWKEHKKLCSSFAEIPKVKGKRSVYRVTPQQVLYRKATRDYLKDIKEPHCAICGDLHKLIKCCSMLVCEECYHIQTEVL